MNISTATRQALIPIEREIRNKPIEYAVLLNKSGKQKVFVGTESKVNISPKWYKIFFQNDKTATHNHPNESKSTLILSFKDIFFGQHQGFREVRAVSEDGFCQLVEIPKMNLLKKIKLLNKLNKYYKNLNKNLEKIENEAIMRLSKVLNRTVEDKVEEIVKLRDSFGNKSIKNVQKILTKEGFKFRTIKLP